MRLRRPAFATAAGISISSRSRSGFRPARFAAGRPDRRAVRSASAKSPTVAKLASDSGAAASPNSLSSAAESSLYIRLSKPSSAKEEVGRTSPAGRSQIPATSSRRRACDAPSSSEVSAAFRRRPSSHFRSSPRFTLRVVVRGSASSRNSTVLMRLNSGRPEDTSRRWASTPARPASVRSFGTMTAATCSAVPSGSPTTAISAMSDSSA